MSFRVWFLRMVWVIAAAVALSGCDTEDDDNKEGTETNDSGPSLMVAFDPATPEAGAEATVVVTVKDGEADDKINIGVMCGKSETLAAQDYEVKDNKATSAQFGVPEAGGAKITCTATASGKVGDKDLSEEKSFDIDVAGSNEEEAAAPTLRFQPDSTSELDALEPGATETPEISVEIIDDAGRVDGDSTLDVTLSLTCGVDEIDLNGNNTPGNAAIIAAVAGVATFPPMSNLKEFTAGKCTLKAEVGTEGQPDYRVKEYELTIVAPTA